MFEVIVAFFGVLIISAFLIPLSQKIGLTDKPNDRKHHEGAIPLVGGIAIFSTISISAAIFVPMSSEMTQLLSACALLAMVGSLDDKFDVSYKVRLIVQSITAFMLAKYGGGILLSFGNLLGYGDITLGFFALPITVIAVVGLVNAFNMIDGLDGLAAGLSLVTIATLHFILNGNVSESAESILLLLIGALSAYLILNLHLFPQRLPKIFLGDAGSMILGFIIVAFLVRYSQGEKQVFYPASALWFVAIPLMDFVSIFIRRIVKKSNPFKPDRGHIHHILGDLGFTQTQTLMIILAMQIILVLIGVYFQNAHLPEFFSFLMFLLVFALYLFASIYLSSSRDSS